MLGQKAECLVGHGAGPVERDVADTLPRQGAGLEARQQFARARELDVVPLIKGVGKLVTDSARRYGQGTSVDPEGCLGAGHVAAAVTVCQLWVGVDDVGSAANQILCENLAANLDGEF